MEDKTKEQEEIAELRAQVKSRDSLLKFIRENSADGGLRSLISEQLDCTRSESSEESAAVEAVIEAARNFHRYMHVDSCSLCEPLKRLDEVRARRKP